MFQFVREYLCRHAGVASKAELLEALQAEARIRRRLDRGQGFARVLVNMRYSGWIEIDDDAVRATPKTLRRTLV